MTRDLREIRKERELLERYDDFLRDVYGDIINICGYKYDTADTFKDTDPTTYRCGFCDWLDSEGIDLDTYEEEEEEMHD